MNGIIKRDHYLQKLIDRRENGMIKVITGIRRWGKSFLLFTLFKAYLMENDVREDHIIEIALDEDTFEAYRDPAKLSDYIRSRIEGNGQFYVFIDEVQLAISREELSDPENVRLYSVLNGLLRLKNVDVYVTGSNSKLLTKDVMTVFRGRGDEVKLYPLSFKEYYGFVGGDRSAAYEEYALYGGMPLVLAQKNDADKMNYLRRLFDEVYFRDIIERYSISLEDVLAELTDVLCSSIGSLTNVSKLERTLKTLRHVDVSGNTVAKYL